MSRSGFIIAALGGGANRALFDRAQVIVQHRDGRLQQADRWEGGRVVGPELTREDVEALVASGEAVWLPRPAPAEPEVRAWTLGAGFGPRRDWLEELLQEGNGVIDRIEVGESTVLLIRERAVGFVRERLTEEARKGARSGLASGKHGEALRDAMLAWLSARFVTPELVALLVEARTRCGELEKAAATRQMEKNTHGPAFDREVGRELAKLQAGARSSAPWRKMGQLSAMLGLDEIGFGAVAA